MCSQDEWPYPVCESNTAAAALNGACADACKAHVEVRLCILIVTRCSVWQLGLCACSSAALANTVALRDGRAGHALARVNTSAQTGSAHIIQRGWVAIIAGRTVGLDRVAAQALVAVAGRVALVLWRAHHLVCHAHVDAL